jgi:hypothetical protein
VEASDHTSIAVVVYACDEMRKGDFLVSFPPERAAEPDHADDPGATEAPDEREPARILFADDGQTLGAPRRLMVVGRGREQGAFVGQPLTLFRQRTRADTPVAIGDAVVVAVRARSSTIRIGRAMDAIVAGDWAVPTPRGTLQSLSSASR